MPTFAASTFAACLPTSLWPCADLLQSASRDPRAGPQDGRPRGPALLSRARCAAMVAGQARPLVFVPQCSRPSALLAACGPRCRSRPLESCPASARAQDASRPVSPANTKAVCGQRVSRAGRRRLLCVSTRRNGSAEERARCTCASFCRAPERAPLTGQNDRRAAHVCSGSRATSTVAGVAAHAGRAVAAAACATQIVN